MLNHKQIPFDPPVRMEVLILDSLKKYIFNYTNVQTNEFGIYQNYFLIPKNSNFGHWTIRVLIRDNKEEKIFNVYDVDENAIQIDVNMSKELSFMDKQINLTIKLKHPTKKNFRRKFVITYDAYSLDNNATLFKDRKFSTNSNNLNALKINEDLGLKSNIDCLVKFNISVKDLESNLESSNHKEVILRKGKIRKIFLKRKKFFRPGLKFHVQADVIKNDGKLDDSIASINLLVKYYSQMNSTSIESKTIGLNNGQGKFLLEPSNDTKSIEIELSGEDFKLIEFINSQPSTTNEHISMEITESR